jgi:hypothetical protein
MIPLTVIPLSGLYYNIGSWGLVVKAYEEDKPLHHILEGVWGKSVAKF